MGGCSGGTAGDAFAGAASGGQTRGPAAVLGGDRQGMSSEDAGIEAGVSPAVGTRWFRDSGGIRPVSLAPLSGRYLSFAEREEIAILRVRGYGVREIARRTGRSPSTISRELRRNAATRGGGLEYRAMAAQWHADLRDAARRSRNSLRTRPSGSMCRTGSPA